MFFVFPLGGTESFFKYLFTVPTENCNRPKYVTRNILVFNNYPMKNLLLPGLCLLLLFTCATAPAQNKIPVNEPDQNKPKLFTNLPDKIPVTITDLDRLLSAENGKTVSFKFGQKNSNSFEGQVISKADDNTVHSVVIRFANFNGATLTLSSSAQPNGTVKFTGRIISFRHGDAYELQNRNDQYILIKKNYYDLINE